MTHEDSKDAESSVTDDQQGITYGEEQSTTTNRHGNNEVLFSRRRKGVKFPGLDSLVQCEERYDILMSYRYYSLIYTTATWKTASVTHIHRILKNLELKMKDLTISREDQIIILDFSAVLSRKSKCSP